jgi:hypothetical protein
MSYLDAPRIHFFGKYFTNPSTISNTLSNYDLKPPLDLSWNPNGSALNRSFRLSGSPRSLCRNPRIHLAAHYSTPRTCP